MGFRLIAAIGLIVVIVFGFFLIRHIQGGRTVSRGAGESEKAVDLNITYADDLKVTVSKGVLKTTLDFEDDVSGSTETYDGSPENVETVPATVRVVDKVAMGGDYYMLLLFTARANANIQGFCGAGEDHTIVWAKLDGGLKLQAKKGVVIRVCQREVNVLDPATMEEIDPDEIPLRTVLRGGRLDVDFADMRDGYDKGEYSHLSYDTRHPEKGVFVEDRVMGKKGRDPKRP
jgi:hypothetical protein